VTVAPRRSALADRPLAEARAEAARLFSIRYVLTGRLKLDAAPTLSLDLLEAGRELPVWSQSFTWANHHCSRASHVMTAIAKCQNSSVQPCGQDQSASSSTGRWPGGVPTVRRLAGGTLTRWPVKAQRLHTG
jgi:hypothetical protein